MPIAILRPSDWEWVLLLHLVGVFLLVGGILVVALAAVVAHRTEVATEAAMRRRIAFRTLLAVALPGYVAMRVGGQWLESKEEGQLFTGDPTWIGIGYIVSDVGALILIVLIVLAWLSQRRAARGDATGSWMANVVLGLAPIYLTALAVAWWAMTAKPD